MQMPREARLIEQVLAQHGVLCRVLPPPHSYETSTLRIYRLQRAEGVGVNRVLGLADELDEALTVARGAAIRCRVDRLPLRLEVPHPHPQPPLLLPLLQGGLKQLTDRQGHLYSVVGESTGQVQPQSQAKVTLLDLTHPNSPHLLVAGTTGSGKTNLLRGLALSLASFHTPHELALLLLDPKGVDFHPLARLPHLALPLLVDPVDAVSALGRVVVELEARKHRAGSQPGTSLSPVQTPRLVLIIDELADLMDVAGSQVEAAIKRILQVGRGLGIHVIGATQKPLASVIGSVVKANFPVRLVGKVASSDDARVASGVGGTGAERLPGLGSFLLVHGSELRRVQAYLLRDEEMHQQVALLRQAWQGQAKTWILPSLPQTHPQSQPNPTPPRIQPVPLPGLADQSRYPQWLREQVTDYIREHQRLPSLRAVQRAYQQETGRMLHWDAIREAILAAEEAVGRMKNEE
jgi:S-DNA-T family DNA segregation ATPase FtsK/SpoIIIE